MSDPPRVRRSSRELAIDVRLYREPTRRVSTALQREAEPQAAFVAATDVSGSVATV